MSNEIYDIAVIGAGAAGTMSTLRAVLNNLKTIVFEGSGKEKKKARATWVSEVENMPFHFDVKKPITFAHKNTFSWIENNELYQDKLTRVKAAANNIKKTDQGFLITSKKGEFLAKYVVLCTGIMDKQPLINGEMDPVFPYANKNKILYCLRCDGHLSKEKDTVVIGSNNGACWQAIMLFERYNNPSMTILTNGETLQSTPETQKLLEHYDIKVNESPILSIDGDEKTPLLEGFTLKDGSKVAAQLALVGLGQIAYNDLALHLGAEVQANGNVLCSEKGESSVDGFYVAGDLRANKKNQIYTSWDMAVDSVDHIDAKIRTSKRPAS
ncbi:MAG: NAD(P)/FAD-dependent oxidoreductase [Candidatus Cloacimonetes bacterium]|nr:NAD(P)/FAD-dependent oxidoreductase [Candidatus Cloacimonadota bacterium]